MRNLKTLINKVSILGLFLLFAILQVNSSQANVVNVKGVKGGGSGKTQFVVNYPLSFIREVISDDELFMRLIPGIRNWKVLKDNGKSQVAKCKMSMTKLAPPASYTVKVDLISKDKVEFTRLNGDLKHLEGYWELKRGNAPNTTLVTYFYKVDTGINLIPKLIIQNELRRHLIETESKTHRELKRIYSENKYLKAKIEK
ncbi:MAG: SRPBCC family protein [Candidatus Caenarcaniphilales bacterium]|nr:SRPBCC family protein [Candidatus Caenarcaniphilales bacterium]